MLSGLFIEFVNKKIINDSPEDRSEVGADITKTTKAINLTTKATKVIKTEKLLNSIVFKGTLQTLNTTANNAGYKAIDSIDSMRLLLRNNPTNLVPFYAGIGYIDEFIGTGEMLQKGLSKIKSMTSEISAPKGVNIKGPKVSSKGVEEGAEKAVKVVGDGAGKYSNLDDGLNFSKKALEHIGENGRQIPIKTLQDAIRNGEAFPDPRGSSATMYYTTMTKNSKLYNLEVLYDPTTNQVYHFEYARKAMGKLSEIKK